MGKGDQRTKRGKIVRGTYGVSRPHKKHQNTKSQQEVSELVEKQQKES